MTDLLHIDIPHRAGDRQIWGQLSGAAESLAISQAVQAHQGISLVITRTSSDADTLIRELRLFLRAAPAIEVLNFPDWETLPYDAFSPHQDIISERLYSLYRLPLLEQAVVVVPITTLMHRLTPPSYLKGNALMIKVGQKIDIERWRLDLERAGYHCVDTVYERGEFALRGSILDIYPMGAEAPYRIDLFDDEVDSLRTFDPETQCSIDPIREIQLLPAKEFPLTPDAIAQFKQTFRDQFDVDHRHCPLYQDVAAGLAPAGIEYYLPLFFEQTATLLDYLPEGSMLLTQGELTGAIEHFWQDVESRYENRRVDPERPLLAPHRVFVPDNELHGAFKRFARIQLEAEAVSSRAGRCNLPFTPAPELPVAAQSSQPLATLSAFIEERPTRLLFCAETAGRREVLLELLAQIDLRPQLFSDLDSFVAADQRFGILVAPIDRSLWLQEPDLLLLVENQLYGQKVQQRRRRQQQQSQSEQVIRNLTELRIGAPVVHIDHGVGRYQGLTTLEIDGQAAEFLTLVYADEAKLYVPVCDLHLISRYTGSDDALAPLHKLGNDSWSKAKRKAAEKARDVAAELLDIYARRAARKGFAHLPPDAAYLSFAAGFPFEETPDQEQAIHAVTRDMVAAKPMDRLVCGDVGFGKTEVAMRAAFLAVHSGKQVAILVPTTLLAQQHYDSFRDRFADWPVEIEVMSRFRSAKQIQTLCTQLTEGQIDIVIGTHKLLQDDIRFKNLGLVIIDEEHRFGVRQKDQLKNLRAEVDVLTLTATPIPRTLNMALADIRDLSIISTPPARRLSVKTFVRQDDRAMIKEAILRELLRGGQVYYLHNDVKNIEKVASDLQELVPEARIGIGHGQMRERELEQVMQDFYHRRFNLLVCTTIIETGIDVPSANTIIIDRADKFGLAQLHQLRGRVGRSHHQAYAYLLTPPRRGLSADAIKRLDAIAQAQDLGAGFTLATHDLEIRGAGELLGEGQSGQIQTVGFTLYMEMLERAVKSIQKGETPNLDQPLHQGAQINLRLPALIPDDYVPDVHNRLILYKRIAGADSAQALKELQVEMIDRFGLLPEATKTLFRQTQLKLDAEALGIDKLEGSDKGGRIEFGPEPRVNPLAIVKLVQNQPQRYRLEGATVLRFIEPMNTVEDRFRIPENLLQLLGSAPS